METAFDELLSKEDEVDLSESSYGKIEDPTNYVEDQDSEESSDYSNNGVYSFLQEMGISDPSKMQFANDDGELEEVDFNNLSTEEQKTVLKELTDPGLSDYEKSLILNLRSYNMPLDQVIDQAAQQQAMAYIQQYQMANQPAPTYAIDDYSDDELYVSDLKLKFPNFTSEELISKLNSAKEDEDLYEKEIAELRAQYKELEDQDKRAAVLREQQDYVDLQNSLVNAAVNFNGVLLDYDDPKSESLVIEDSDKREILSYLLDRDASGRSQFAKELEDPDALVEIAWLRTKGADLLAGTTRYYKNEIRKAHQRISQLEKQLGKSTNKSSTVIIENKNSNNRNAGLEQHSMNYFDKLI